MSRPQNSFLTLPGPQKANKGPKIKSKSKIRIEGNTEKMSFKYMTCNTSHTIHDIKAIQYMT